jgi:hypothetical protein
MPTSHNDVVVADGMLQQIRLQVYNERDLRAAEMVTLWGLDGLCFGNEITVHFRAAPFK